MNILANTSQQYESVKSDYAGVGPHACSDQRPVEYEVLNYSDSSIIYKHVSMEHTYAQAGAEGSRMQGQNVRTMQSNGLFVKRVDVVSVHEQSFQTGWKEKLTYCGQLNP